MQRAKRPGCPTENTAAIPKNAEKTYNYELYAAILIYCFVFFPLAFFFGELVLMAMIAISIYSFMLVVMGGNKTIKQALYCSILTTLACLSVWISIGSTGNRIFYNWQFTEYDRQVAKSIISNTKEADDKQQSIENWCDMLKKSGDVPRVFGPSDNDNDKDSVEENDFVLNRAAAELIVAGKEIPKDMVFLFQGAEGWNQIGGKDKLAASYRYGVVCAVMGDHSTMRIPLKKIDRLMWDINDTPQTLANTSMTPIYTLNTAVIAAGICVLLLRRRYAVRYAILAILFAAASAVAGYYFSQFGSDALYIGEPSKLTDFATVYVISATVGAAFVLLLAPSITSSISRRELFFKTALLGGLCGLTASTLIHIYIMIWKETLSPWGMIGGAGYGIYAGVVLGVITYWMTYLSGKLKQQCQPPRPSDTPPCEGGEL